MVKLKAKLPKDDANGLDASEQELVSNLRNGKTVPVIALLATEDVLARNSVPIAVIADIEAVPDGSRAYVLQLMGKFKADRTGAKQGAVQLDLNEEGDVAYVGEGDEQ